MNDTKLGECCCCKKLDVEGCDVCMREAQGPSFKSPGEPQEDEFMCLDCQFAEPQEDERI